jgi:uncharacterized protein YbaR (Trm112 family)
MHLELQCPRCSGVLELGSDTGTEYRAPAGSFGPWDALGDGETLEDRLYAVLDDQGELRCPECGAACPLNEENVGRWAMELLSSW